MAPDKTRHILTALSNGVDPFTGEAFPDGSPYQHPDVVRVLFHALRQAEAAGAEAAGTPGPAAPSPKKPARSGKAGRPWSPEEDAQLAAGFDAGHDLPSLAALLERSRFAVEVRLAKLGRLPLPETTRFPLRQSAPAKAEEPAVPYTLAA